METAATGTTPRTDWPGDRLERTDGTDLEGIEAVEAVALPAIIGEQDDSGVALSTAGFAIAPIRNSSQIWTKLP